MSQFIPYRSVYAEYMQQEKRLQHGLKTGTHVYYPDPKIGPFILTKTKAEAQREIDKDLNPEQKRSLLDKLIGRRPPEQPYKTRLMTAGHRKPLNRTVRRKISKAEAKKG